jgi:hypothetical protein
MHSVPGRVHLAAGSCAFAAGQDNNVFFVGNLSNGADARRIFGFLEHLMVGSEVRASILDFPGVSELAAVLGNIDLLSKAVGYYEIDLRTICVRLSQVHADGNASDEEISFAASHFYELDFENGKKLGVCVIERILCSPELRLETEDSLLEFISSVDCHPPILLRHVHSEYLTSKSVSSFLDSLLLHISIR